jgi:hypothetical protein
VAPNFIFMKTQNILIILVLAAVGFYIWRKQTTNQGIFSVNTPGGGLNLGISQSSAGAIQANAALNITKKGKKKKKVWGKIGNFVKKNAGTALTFIPGVGPALGAGYNSLVKPV